MIGSMSLGQIDLKGPKFFNAVTAIRRRAESQTDLDKLTSILVESDISMRSEVTDSQLIVGRRGTGKTHLISAFAHRHQMQGDVVFSADCRKLASSYTESAHDIIGAKFFIVLFNSLATFLFDYSTRLEYPDPKVEEQVQHTILYGLIPFVDGYNQNGLSRFNYRQIHDATSNVIRDLEIPRLYVILDEWSSIPIDAQPHVAEYLKRSLLPIPEISLKILAVNYQNRLRGEYHNSVIGIERGADITDTIDLDSYLVYDEKIDFMQDFFAQVIYNHLAAELSLPLNVSVDEKKRQVLLLFTREPAFRELVRAGEGNCRDLLCIFCNAVYVFRKNSEATQIGIPHVREAARMWYENEKENNVKTDSDAMKTLDHIFYNVLKGYKSRTFMVETSKDNHPRIVKLLSDRIIHKYNRTYSHPDRAGIRYSIFTLDYGAYARHVGTSSDPNRGLESEEHAVPIDDLRSIRRIVFDPEELQITAE